jgi:hypothetical protein
MAVKILTKDLHLWHFDVMEVRSVISSDVAGNMK